MNYTEAVAYINETPKFTTKNSLEHTKECLRRLGNPQDSFQVIHVAGTNGKGSVCAYLASVLREGGYRCGLFTSPHLVKINERFQIDEVPVEDELFLRAFEKVKHLADELTAQGSYHPTYFEMLFLMGMCIFQEAGVSYVVLETGLGGRLDATNAIENPLACVITSISMDHIQYLGDTVEAIAGEKAGIIKKAIPVIYDANRHETAQVIEETAQRVGAPAYPVRREDFEIREITSSGIEFSYGKTDGRQQEYSIPFIARYQVMNSALALKTLEVLREQQDFTALTDSQVKAGIGGTRWQGRMETIQPGVIVDGAHNEDGVANFIETAVYFRDKYRIVLLFSAVDDKDYPHMIRRICSELRPAQVVTATIQEERAVDAQVLAQEFRKNGCTCVQAENSVKEAFQQAAELRGDGLLFCIGSLYLIGEIKSLI
ncbi:MAG: bifunctional folylpolyglutamate synthase/dihydrofolate synthase [Lachnospiraceae bacterium]|nr:bifunctional folylpolyglutamate synthase/dihydrofolate synthase [Lachnospiraceae bacterium]